MNLECLSFQFTCPVLFGQVKMPYPSPYRGSAIFVLPPKLNYKPNLDQFFPKNLIRLKSGCTPPTCLFFLKWMLLFFLVVVVHNYFLCVCVCVCLCVCFCLFFWFVEPMTDVALCCSSLWAPAGIIIETPEQGTSHYYWTKTESLYFQI